VLPAGPTRRECGLTERLDDRTLFDRCKSGDEAAWRLLVGRYENLVFSTALQTGLDRDSAVDAFQQVWMELHRSLLRIRDAQALPRWLIVTTRRIAYRQAIVAGRWVHDVREDLADPSPGPDSVIVTLERRHALERALRALDKRCRQVLSMLFLSEPKKSYADVSRETGLAEDSVGAIRTRCLSRLRTLMEGSHE